MCAGEEHGAQHWIEQGWASIEDPRRATISRYAHGRDYHKVVRQRLQKLAGMIEGEIGPFGYRVFADSAPVMEVELARQAGIGWRGKHTLLLSRDAGSMFFLGELFVDIPLPVDPPVSDHCGGCTRCIDVCPTRAIVAPYRLDARRCISYLTIELAGAIPVEFRPLIGNRIYGCDDCQLVCPWNKFARRATVRDFDSRGIEASTLVELFGWSEDEFLSRTEGSAIRRIGHERWLRNVAVALGNALAAELSELDRAKINAALQTRVDDESALVREHVAWALRQGELSQA
jgi:epoxyqueuosine reductase